MQYSALVPPIKLVERLKLPFLSFKCSIVSSGGTSPAWAGAAATMQLPAPVSSENLRQTNGALYWSNLCVSKSGEKKTSKATKMQQMCLTISSSDARVSAEVCGIHLWNSQLGISQLQVVQFLSIPAEAADLVLTLHFVSSSTKCSCTDHQVN